MQKSQGRKGEREKGLQRTISSEQSDGRASGTSTTRPANAMDVVLRVVGVIIVDDVSDVAHVFMTERNLRLAYYKMA